MRYRVETTTRGNREHLYTVVGELPGTASGGDYVLLGAHLDSWIGGTGATDNAAGVAITLEAMRLLRASAIPLNRTVRVALYSGEEQGLLCSSAYAERHVGHIPRSDAVEQRDIVANAWRQPTGPLVKGADYDRLSTVFNVDSGTGRFRAALTGGGNPSLATSLRSWTAPLADLGIVAVLDEPDWPADQVNFTTLGIPGISFLQDPLDYDSRAHHTDMDTVERLNPSDLAQASVALAALAASAANTGPVMARTTPNDKR